MPHHQITELKMLLHIFKGLNVVYTILVIGIGICTALNITRGDYIYLLLDLFFLTALILYMKAHDAAIEELQTSLGKLLLKEQQEKNRNEP